MIRTDDNDPAVGDGNHRLAVGKGTMGVPAGVVVIPMSDTVKEVVDGRVRRTVPRETLAQVTGPWVFDRQALVDAMSRVAGAETSITDMIGFCEAAHVRVRVLPAR